MTVLRYVFIAFEVVLLFNLLIAVHELGHFLAAKWRGLKIDRYAIWFGKPIWKRKIGGVEYVLGSIPAGGYVALPQMATMEMIEGKSETKVTTHYGASVWTTTEAIEGKSETPAEMLPNVSALNKIIVAFAGPLFSLLLAVVFAFVVWGVGKPGNGASDSTMIGWVEPAGPAWQAGLRPGDTILEVDGHPVKNFTSTSANSVKWRIITSTSTNIAIKYLRDGKEAMAYAMPTNLPTKWYERRALRQISISYAEKSVIGEIASNSPAALAGLKAGDEIVAMNGRKIFSPLTILFAEQALTNKPNVPAAFTIRRGSKQFDRTLLAVKPIQPTNSGPLFGIVSWQGDTNVALVYPSPLEQIKTSAGLIFNTFSALFAHKSEIGVQQLGGVVMIARVYYNLFQSENGWRQVLWFSVLLNVNLALINILPLPVLDGGHILFSLIEAVRRRPVNAKFLNFIQTGFAALLIAFMVYITFFDTGDWLRSARDNREQPIVFTPGK
jgi:regulator of sigma E protease